MRSVTVRLDDLRTMILNLGYVGENEHRTFNFDCKKMFGEYPSASVSLTVQPPAGDCYLATVERDGDLVSWTVTDSDLIEEGCGEIQLTFMVGEVVAKTCIGRTKVERSLGATGDIPTPIENWIEQAEEVISEAEAATAAAEAAAEHQPIIDDNGYWAVWDAEAEEYAATEYKAQGTDGHDGVGIVSIEKTGTSGLVDTYTITFTSGNPVTYTVTNGRDADPTEIIDDKAGAGDTDKVWSADKSHALLTEINSKADKTVTDALQKNKAPVIIDHAEGNPIVLTDGADGLPVEGMDIAFTPMQELHGYDSPWPAGGGKNKANMDDVQIGIAWNGGRNSERATVFINVPPSTTYTASVTGADGLSTTYAEKTDATSIANLYLSTFANSITRTTTASTGCIAIQFAKTGGISAADLANVKVQLELGSIATSYSPYSNICPIEGRTGLTVWRAGKNLLDPGEATSGKGLTLTKNADGSISVEGTPTGTWIDFGWHDVGIRAGSYMLSLRASIPCSFVLYYYIVGDSTRKYHALVNGQTSKAITFEGEVERICFGLSSMNTSTAYDFNLAVQIELGSTSPYAPYTGQSYPITFPDGQTIYGGTLDAVTGVLSVEWASVLLNGSEEWGLANGVFYAPLTGYARIGGQAVISDKLKGLADISNTTTMSSKDDNSIATQFNISYNRMFIKKTDCADVSALETWLENNPVTLAYILATPIEIPLSAISLTTLLGDNTIWSDANGTIELDYRADTKLFIAKQKTDIRATIAPIEDGTTASQAYSAGKFFYHDGNFCKAKTSIAAGATFTLNTNYEVTTVADELFALN